MRRSLAPAAVLTLVTSLAAGCGDDDGSGSDESGGEKETPVVALTAEQIEQAVLQDENLGEGWTSAPSSDDGSAAPGCFADVEVLIDGLSEKAKGGTEFEYGEEDRPFVQSTVTAYAEEQSITSVFDQVQTVLAACSSVAETDEEGITWDLTLSYDDAATYDEVDDQFHLTASGTFSHGGGDPTEVSIEWSTFRLGPNVGAVTTIDTQERPDEHANWTGIAVDRLDDVAHGEEPEATTAPAPAGDPA